MKQYQVTYTYRAANAQRKQRAVDWIGLTAPEAIEDVKRSALALGHDITSIHADQIGEPIGMPPVP